MRQTQIEIGGKFLMLSVANANASSAIAFSRQNKLRIMQNPAAQQPCANGAAMADSHL
jgi:hypothetical protein